MKMQVTTKPFRVSIFFDASDIGYNGFQTIEWIETPPANETENLHRDCHCGENEKADPHECPGAIEGREGDLCTCCIDCQMKCDGSL